MAFVPSRLKDARIEKGLNQKQLSELCENCSRVTISNLEKGITTPKKETVLDLSISLKKSFSYFFVPEFEEVVGESPVAFRSYHSRTVMQRNQALIKKKKLKNIVQYLFSYLREIPINIELYSSNPLDLEDKDIESLANKLRKQWQLSNNPIVDLVTIVENNGIVCSSIKLPARIDAFNFSFTLPKNNQECRIIAYENNSSYYRQRFDIAHELGHIVMHSFLDESDYEENYKLLENQANRFASAFLLPRDEFKYSIEEYSFSKLLELKQYWGVSFAAIIRRLKDLRIITESQYKNYNFEISRRKWRAIEPYDKETEKEKPYLLGEAFKFLFSSNRFSPISVSNKTALDLEELKEYTGYPELFHLNNIRKIQMELF